MVVTFELRNYENIGKSPNLQNSAMFVTSQNLKMTKIEENSQKWLGF